MIINRKRIVVALFIVVLVFVVFLIINGQNKGREYVTTGPEYIGKPIANFTGGKSTEFYDSQTDTNYNAARNIIGDFLINSEKIEIKSGTKTTAVVEITDYTDEYGEDTQYISNFTFKSIDNGKTYKAKIINYLNNSQSSRLIVIDKNYERTFGNVIN